MVYLVFGKIYTNYGNFYATGQIFFVVSCQRLKKIQSSGHTVHNLPTYRLSSSTELRTVQRGDSAPEDNLCGSDDTGFDSFYS